MSLKGKVALVTGGVKNLGAEIARELALAGADLALHYNSDKTKADAVATEKALRKDFPSIRLHCYQGDLTTGAAVDKLFDSVLADFGKIDILVNTVGRVYKHPMAEISEEEYDRMFAVNSKCAFLLMKNASRPSKDGGLQDGGKIITIVTSLLAAFTGLYTSYAGSKAPVEHFTRGAAKELQSRKISVNAIGPGPIDTPFFYGQESSEAVAYHKSQGMGGRLTDVKDIAPFVRFLCVEGAWMTGQTIFPNGGYTTR